MFRSLKSISNFGNNYVELFLCDWFLIKTYHYLGPRAKLSSFLNKLEENAINLPMRDAVRYTNKNIKMTNSEVKVIR